MAFAFAIALVVLHELTHRLQLSDILAAAAGIGLSDIATALGVTALSYTVLTLYDVLALRQVGRALPYRRVAATSFIAFAFGHNVGLVGFSSRAIRYRL